MVLALFLFLTFALFLFFTERVQRARDGFLVREDLALVCAVVGVEVRALGWVPAECDDECVVGRVVVQVVGDSALRGAAGLCDVAFAAESGLVLVVEPDAPEVEVARGASLSRGDKDAVRRLGEDVDEARLGLLALDVDRGVEYRRDLDDERAVLHSDTHPRGRGQVSYSAERAVCRVRVALHGYSPGFVGTTARPHTPRAPRARKSQT